jgi:hypothetical protein
MSTTTTTQYVATKSYGGSAHLLHDADTWRAVYTSAHPGSRVESPPHATRKAAEQWLDDAGVILTSPWKKL